MSLIKSYLHLVQNQPMNDLEQINQQLYDLCRRNPDILETLVSAYLIRCDDDEIEQIEILLDDEEEGLVSN